MQVPPSATQCTCWWIIIMVRYNHSGIWLDSLTRSLKCCFLMFQMFCNTGICYQFKNFNVRNTRKTTPLHPRGFVIMQDYYQLQMVQKSTSYLLNKSRRIENITPTSSFSCLICFQDEPGLYLRFLVRQLLRFYTQSQQNQPEDLTAAASIAVCNGDISCLFPDSFLFLNSATAF